MTFWIFLIIAFLVGAWLERKAIQTYGEYWKHGLYEKALEDENGEYFRVHAINQRGTPWKYNRPLSVDIANEVKKILSFFPWWKKAYILAGYSEDEIKEVYKQITPSTSAREVEALLKSLKHKHEKREIWRS